MDLSAALRYDILAQSIFLMSYEIFQLSKVLKKFDKTFDILPSLYPSLISFFKCNPTKIKQLIVLFFLNMAINNYLIAKLKHIYTFFCITG